MSQGDYEQDDDNDNDNRNTNEDPDEPLGIALEPAAACSEISGVTPTENPV